MRGARNESGARGRDTFWCAACCGLRDRCVRAGDDQCPGSARCRSDLRKSVKLNSHALPPPQHLNARGAGRILVRTGKTPDRFHHEGHEGTRRVEFDGISNRVIGCGVDVHRKREATLPESPYEQCLAHEPELSGITRFVLWLLRALRVLRGEQTIECEQGMQPESRTLRR